MGNKKKNKKKKYVGFRINMTADFKQIMKCRKDDSKKMQKH